MNYGDVKEIMSSYTTERGKGASCRELIIQQGCLVGLERETRAFFNLFDPIFSLQSGCSHEKGHHYGFNGLITHTWEVISLCSNTADFYKWDTSKPIDYVELFLSALFHDVGKCRDYEFPSDDSPTFTSSAHKRTIHHISRSAIEWEKFAEQETLFDTKFVHRVTHNILSHHGQRQFGSPVAPLSREAWILHLCDNISARVDDCDRLDLIQIKT